MLEVMEWIGLIVLAVFGLGLTLLFFAWIGFALVHIYRAFARGVR